MAGYCQIARHKGGCERDGDIKREDQSQSAAGRERRLLPNMADPECSR